MAEREEIRLRRPLSARDYREILKQLENEGTIDMRSTKGKRRAGTFAEHVLIRFPVGVQIGN